MLKLGSNWKHPSKFGWHLVVVQLLDLFFSSVSVLALIAVEKCLLSLLQNYDSLKIAIT